MPPSLKRLALIVSCLVAAAARLVGAAEESPKVDPPAIYRERLAGLLTPIDEVLKRQPPPTEADDSGSILLDERVTWVDGEGRRTSVRQFAYRTLTEAGVKSNADEVTRFSKKEQKAYLVLAETIRSNGTRVAVRPDAVLIESPQRQASYSLYDDQAEMRVIFPDVKPGCVVHGIVVVEDVVARIPGEYSHTLLWNANWAIGEYRYRLELPSAMAARLHVANLGDGVPKMVSEDEGNGRVARTWTVNRRPGHRDEINRQPASQVGPSIHLTTLASWDDVARWYRGLIKGHDQPGGELAAQAAKWVGDARDSATVIGILHQHVANQVRYVGLEFGQAGYQPHDCNEVWANQYGDCKDKANLLVALLQSRGIKAYVTLVNTEHLGWVDRRSPTYQDFDHAIVAVPTGGAKYLFCDPTMDYSEPGTLGPGASDRDVFVVRENGGEWVHTPPATNASLHYDFDLKLAANGEIAGWLAMTSDGYYAAWERSRFTELEMSDVRSVMGDRARGFFPGAEIVDVDRPATPGRGPYRIRAYFIVPGNARGDARPTMVFPNCDGLLPEVGDHPERTTNFYADVATYAVSVRCALPPNLRGGESAAPFRFNGTSADLRASWKLEPGACVGELRVLSTHALVKPSDFPALYQATRGLSAWLGRPVTFASGAVAEAKAADAPEIDLPMMPTGGGEIDLIDRRYPEEGDPRLRSVALQRALQYFPNDPAVAVRAGARLALIDWNADRNEAAHERLQALRHDYPGRVTAEIFAWVEYCDGLVLRDLKRNDEAVTLLTRVAGNKDVSDSRRADAAAAVADIELTTAPDKAQALLEEVAALPQGATAAVLSRLIHLQLISGHSAEARHRLADLINGHPDDRDDRVAKMLQAVRSWSQPDDELRAGFVAGMVTELFPGAPEAVLKEVNACRLAAVSRRIHTRYLAMLKEEPLSTIYQAKPGDASRSAADFDKERQAASDKGDAGESLRVALRALASRGLDDGFPERLWQAGNEAEWAERQIKLDPSVCEKLVDLCDQLPSDEAFYFEGRLVRARRFATAHNWEAERDVLQRMLDQAAIPPVFVAAAAKKLGLNRVRAGDLPAAAAAYRRAGPVAKLYGSGADCVLRGALVELHLGHDDEALRFLNLIGDPSENLLKACESPDQLRELSALAAGGHAREFWDASRAWWPEWRNLMRQRNATPDEEAAATPVVPELTKVGEALRNAINANKAEDFLRQVDLLASGARWLPSYGVEIGTTTSIGLSPFGDQATHYQELVLSILKIPTPPGSKSLAQRQLMLAAAYFDCHQSEGALRVWKEFDPEKSAEPRIVEGMHRVRGLAALALNRDVAEVAADIESDLANDPAMSSRELSVTMLGDLYARLGRLADQTALYQREIDKATTAGDQSVRTQLQARFSQLTGGSAFGTLVADWIKARQFGWFEIAEPASLQDPRLRNLESLLEKPNPSFNYIEQTKINLLAARDSTLTVTQRRMAFLRAVSQLMARESSLSRRLALAGSVVDEPRFDRDTRTGVLWMALRLLALDGRGPEYAVWRRRPEVSSFDGMRQSDLKLMDGLASVDRTSPAAIVALAEQITTDEIDFNGCDILRWTFGLILRSGDLAAAEKVLDRADSWRVGPDAPVTAEGMQIEFARQLRQAKLLAPVHEVLTARIEAHFPEVPASLPESCRDANHQFLLVEHSAEDTWLAGRRLIAQRGFERGNLYFWREFLSAVARRSDNSGPLLSELAHAALAATPDDDTRAEIIGLFAGSFDLDDPDLRSRLFAEVNSMRDPATWPRTYSRIRGLEFSMADRTGTLSDPMPALAEFTDSEEKERATHRAATWYVLHNDAAGLRRLINGLDARLLTDTRNAPVMLAAFALLHDDTERETLKKLTRRQLSRDLAESWDGAISYEATKVLWAAEALGDPQLLPEAWVSAVTAALASPRTSCEVIEVKAMLDSDWPRLRDAALRHTRDYPRFYHDYYFLGLADQHLGRRDEAVAALETYVKFAHDELQYSQANEILRKLKETPAASRPSD
ncbi:MAG TPA: DUF3857 and transglutaminase domain-containing protein [Candidatus Didemnitutus sp.]|nr:DUF3857 and transglutaminase domain-containing protein [Candidatus Didemnitutus sp.]